MEKGYLDLSASSVDSSPPFRNEYRVEKLVWKMLHC
jgi:hypothetical protein